jgi:hypothetical protein
MRNSSKLIVDSSQFRKREKLALGRDEARVKDGLRSFGAAPQDDIDEERWLPGSLRDVADVREARTEETVGHSGRDDRFGWMEGARQALRAEAHSERARNNPRADRLRRRSLHDPTQEHSQEWLCYEGMGETRGRWHKSQRYMVLALVAMLWLVPCCGVVRGQNLDKPVINIDEEVTAFSYAADGRIAYSVRRMYKAKKYELQRDDIWMMEPGGKRRKLFNGEKFTPGDKPFTYQVESFTWSPNGKILAVQLFTTSVDVESGRTEDARALLFVDDNGRELRPSGKEPLVMEAEHPLWLRDNATVIMMKEEVAPREMFSMQYLYMSSGPGQKAFEGRTFRDAARISGSNSAIAVERDRNMDGPPRLQRLELLAQDDKELATLDAFVGGLSVSPSGTKAAYYLDNEVLEIRDLESPNKVARMRVGLGVLQWNADETRIYLKRTIEKKSADLVSVAVPPLVAYKAGQTIPVMEPTPNILLHGLTVREFGLSPDGRFLAVVLPGKRNLQIFGF